MKTFEKNDDYSLRVTEELAPDVRVFDLRQLKQERTELARQLAEKDALIAEADKKGIQERPEEIL